MTLLLLLSLLITTPSFAEPAYCEEVREVIMEAVKDGVLSINEANEMLNRCAGRRDFDQ